MCCGHICRVTGKKKHTKLCSASLKTDTSKKISQNTKQQFISVTTAKVMLHKIFCLAYYLCSLPALSTYSL